MDTGVVGMIGPGEQRFLSQTDEQLVALHRTGTPGAMQELMRRYKRELFLYLKRFLNSRAAAEDVFQETFIQIHQSAGIFKVDKRFKPWLFTIASNKARDHLRKRKRTRALALDAEIEGSGRAATFVSLMESDVPLPDQSADQAQLAGLVREAVEELPDNLREVLLLVYFQKLAYKEVAEILEIPLGTVKSRLHAAVAQFGLLWKSRYPGPAEDPEFVPQNAASDTSPAPADQTDA